MVWGILCHHVPISIVWHFHYVFRMVEGKASCRQRVIGDKQNAVV